MSSARNNQTDKDVCPAGTVAGKRRSPRTPQPIAAVRFEPAASGPTPAEAVAFTDQFQQLMAALDDEEQRLVDLKLQQYTNDEAAERLGCSERTVRRLLKRVRSRLERAFQVSD